MDIRHPLKQLDRQLIDWSLNAGVKVHILLTKSDKLSKSRAMNAVNTVKHNLNDHTDISVQAFSSLTRYGVQQSRETVCAILTETDGSPSA